MKTKCTTRLEVKAQQLGYEAVAGVDEAGRGSLFGPVVAAAVILDLSQPIEGMDDSKKLTAKSRNDLDKRIRDTAFAWAVAEIDASRIDAWNILEATKQAMMLAITSLLTAPDLLLIDAVKLNLPIQQCSLIHGDAMSVSIAAASILAKVRRDAIMKEWDAVYPQYGLAKHKGYATVKHRAALALHGPTQQHRQSYEPIRRIKEAMAAGKQLKLFAEVGHA